MQRKLCLGSGCMPVDDAINLDIRKWEGFRVDVLANLEFPLPFKDEVFEIVTAKDVLEHIRNLPQLMGEVHRVLIPNGKFHFSVPYYTARSACQAVDHVRFFTHDSMMHFNRNATGSGWDLGTNFFFEGSWKFNYYSEAEAICKKLGITLEEAVSHLNNIVDTIEWKLKKV